ncbi:hypothetical protein D3C74_313610 [compost metagenome]
MPVSLPKRNLLIPCQHKQAAAKYIETEIEPCLALFAKRLEVAAGAAPLPKDDR